MLIRLVPRSLSLVAVCLLAACADAPGRTPVEPAVQAAKPPGGGGGGQPRVENAVPDAAAQGVQLDVRVLGNGFDNGSTARWLRSDGSDSEITTLDTRFVSPSELVATIRVDEGAEDQSLYDIEVETLRGKKGLGAELFRVDKNAGGPPDNGVVVVETTLRDALGDALRPEQSGPFAGASYDETDPSNPDIGTHLAGNGNLMFNVRDSGTRSVYLTTYDATGAVIETGHRQTRIYTNDNAGGADLRTMADGESIDARLFVEWTVGDSAYQLRYGVSCAGDDFEPDPAHARPGERVTVVRTNDGSANNWTIESAPLVGGVDAVRCAKRTRGKRTTVETPVRAVVHMTLDSIG